MKTVPLKSEPARETVRTIAQGEIVGLIAENGTHTWRGIPFAASTGGANRWRAPQPAPAWKGRREALQFAPRCTQITTSFDKGDGVKPGQVLGSEDCLALDIYAPADSKGRALPVMVWIHGGANVWGRSSSYDGSRLAKNEDVIVVAVQYRLGPFGWFAHRALRESAGSTEDGAASFATLDLIASLEWVRDNISVFGGNPENVTIFGQSAGGHNVVTLLASPHAKGLFHRAIIQSGSFDSVSLEEAEYGGEDGFFSSGNTIAEKLKATTADELRALPAEQLLGAYRSDGGFIDSPRVIADGVALPDRPLRELFTSIDTFNCVPIITGATRDEMKLFYLGNPKMTRKALGKLFVARDPDFYDSISHYISRVWQIRSVSEPASQMVAAGHDAVYTYRFDWDDGGHFGPTDLKQLLGAGHGLEIPFVFNLFPHKEPGDKLLFSKKTRRECEELSRAMGAYWASFARHGIPSCDGYSDWPVFGNNQACLRFDAATDGGIEVGEATDNLDSLVSDLINDSQIDDRERQRIIEELDNWMFTRPVREEMAALIKKSSNGSTSLPKFIPS